MAQKLIHFPKWLDQIMKRNKISVRQLADKTGVSRKDIRNWLRGTSLPKTAYFVFLLKALSILTECDEDLLYTSASEAILRDS